MQNQNAAAFTEMVTQALKRAGLRGILATGWGALSEVNNSDQLFAISDVPHSWLFPRVAAVVHHGGVGTTAAGLRAGVPSLLVPFFGDQFFWGRRVCELGAGPHAIPRNELTSERLADGLKTCVRGSSLRERARRLGEEIRSEDGIARAVDAIGEIARRSERRLSVNGFSS
jgi:UDP:flavonoid glycosyltransferase YjiC (YdhE family)